MATSDSSLDESQFHCSICLQVFTDPVTTPCGHNYCQSCIDQYWNRSDYYKCPLCQETFPVKPKLRINTSFREVVSHFQRMNICDLEPAAQPGEVACDVCTERKLKALKSCLTCLTSYCETHLEPHQRVSGLKIHKLIDPVENLEDRICKKHQRLLELFCRCDQRFLCQICSETDHKKHQVVLVDAEFEHQKTSINHRMVEIQQMIKDRYIKRAEINFSVEMTERNAVKELETCTKVFDALFDFIKRSQEAVVLEIMEKKNAAMERAEGFGKDLEQEITELQCRNTELEKLLHTEDHLHVLQRFNHSCRQLPLTKSWADIRVDQEDFLSSVRYAVSEVEGFVRTKANQLSSTELNRMQKFAVNLQLDPDTAGPWLIISEDGKQVRKSLQSHEVPDNPERFTEDVCVLAKQGFRSGKHYWEVGVWGKSNWIIGVAVTSVKRKEFLLAAPDHDLFTIGLNNGNEYSANTNPSLHMGTFTPLRVLGVFLDYDGGQVSFFNAESKSHLFTYRDCGFREKVLPFFEPCLLTNSTEITPLVVTDVQASESFITA